MSEKLLRQGHEDQHVFTGGGSFGFHDDNYIGATKQINTVKDNWVDFYRVYNEVNPVDAGYKDRKDIYNLYHLLNHLNLFGPAYLSGVLRIVNHYS